MPLYDYECHECGVEFEEIQTIADRSFATCTCGGQAKLFIKPGRAPGVSLFKGGWYRDIASKPIYVDTPQELRNACDRNNVYSHYLGNGPWRTSPGPDPEKFCGAKGSPEIE